MDDRLKQRLVGAVVIISLGVIFLPAILDGGRYTEFEKIRIEIPQRPDVDFSSSIAPLAPPEVRLPAPAEPEISPDLDAIDTAGKAPILDEELKEMIKPIEAPKEVVSKQGKDMRKPAEDASKAAKPGPKAEQPKVAKSAGAKPSKVISKPAPSLPLPRPSAVSAWVVQVGSFTSRDSAIGLRDKLRKQGFAAFVESFEKNGKSSHRVRIGPETSRDRSEKTLASLKQKMQLKGIVVTYP